MREPRDRRPVVVFLFACVVALAGAACAESPASDPGDAVYFGVEIGGTLCGYVTLETSDSTVDGRPMDVVAQRVFLQLSALGSPFDTTVDSRIVVDPASGRYVEAKVELEQGPTKNSFRATIDGDVARVASTVFADERVVGLPSDVIFDNPAASPHLVRDFAEGTADEKTYDLFVLIEGAVQPTRYTRAGRETLHLAGRDYDTIVLDTVNLVNALKTRIWLDPDSGRVVQATFPGERRVYLADPTVAKKIEVASLDSTILTKAGVSIPDFRSIASMKVRAKIDPVGLVVTPESLNVPGQTFRGTVTDNLIEGVFEIAHRRYDGSDAPPFPPRFGDDEALQPFLAPSDLIQSTDPVLVAHAREITTGATDSWDAAHRIADWVAREIDYAIPGGGTARRTFDTRAGECGAHSNLVAALCRAVGIPARVVWGCMYVPEQGGAFGQHGWNEVYMGPAGWVALDATTFETDYVDSGHIRIGVHEALTTALNAVEMEVLDHAMVASAEVGAEQLARYEPYVGTYTNPEGGRKFEVRVQDGNLVVEIPGQAVLPLDDPDDEGRWACKLTDRLYAEFARGAEETVEALRIHERVRMRRVAAPETIDPSVPEPLRPYLGTYLLAAANAEFTVLHTDGGLAVRDPLAKKTIGLREPDDGVGWIDEFGKNRISFDRDADGAVVGLAIDAVSEFRRD